MELKVWCEGIQRVICGVTEATSCHDVVVALAQAMDRTGRYTLVEKWRESERLVSPDENPLLILHKWGEYASDVQFILRHSGAKDRPGSGGRHDDRSDPRRTSKLSYHNFTPHSMSESRSSSTSSLRKSLTFSGAHSHSLLVPKNGKLKNHAGSSGRGLNQNSSLESLTEQSSQSSHSQFNNSSGHSSFETRNRSRLQDSLSSQSSVSSLDNRNRSGLPLTRPSHAPPQPPTHGNIPFTYTNGSLDRTRKRHQASSPASVTIGNHRHQLSNSSTASSSSQLVPSPTGSVPRGSVEPPGRHRPSPPSLARLHKESNNNDVHYKPSSGGGGGLVTVAERGSEESSRQQGDDKRADLIKVINLQLEKLKAQQENIADVEKEIKFKEEREEKQKAEEERILSEIAVLQHQETDLDGEIQDLELVSWVDKLEMEQEKERRIKNEIETVRGKIQDCAEKLEEQEQLIKTLTADLEREETARSRELDQERQEEARVKREISEVKSQLIDRRAATDMQQSIIDKVATEVKVTEGLIRDKTAEVSELETQLKDSNMERFSKSPADWIRGSHEGRASFTNRPSSARRLESPQRLKETVATAKNPHGLWV